jgi:hypothetical protein
MLMALPGQPVIDRPRTTTSGPVIKRAEPGLPTAVQRNSTTGVPE